MSPHGVAPVVSMVDYPWDHRVHHLDEPDAGPRRDGGAADPTDEGVLSTNLTEADVVRGNRQKVKDVLEHVAHRPNPGRKMVLFSNTCVPTVTGEDVESLVRQAARTADVPMLFLAMTPRSMHNVFRDLLLGLRRDAEATAGAPDPAAVNLVGFPDERATHELEALLGRVGIRVNCLLLPDLDVERLHRAPNAALNVFLPNKLWDTHYDHLRTDSRTPGITPPAPYGWAGTLRWLEAVVAALGVGGDPAAAWEAHVADLREGWARACERAARCRLGFIARGEDTRFLLNPAETWGIPLVEMTQEAGFGLDVLLKVHDRDDARGKALEVATLFTQPNTHQVRGFNSLELMRQRLREATCQAVLSQHFFDWRLTEAGKGRFSLQHFEMGAGGAIRTAERLAGICATPYYRQYGRYLRRTREGLRAPAGGPAKGGA